MQSLVSAQPPALEEVRAVLQPDEAVLSFYFGRENSFAWVVAKQGPAHFAMIPAGRSEVDGKIGALRQALEPNVTTVGEIPPFDVALAFDLFQTLMKPTEATWRPATNLLVVTNGALGRLPLGLLPTAPVSLKPEGEPLFANYREVAWLARTHAVSMVPSVAALTTLRRLPSGSSKRDKLIGFGDPYFSETQAQEASKEMIAVRVADAQDAMRQLNPLHAHRLPLRQRASPKIEVRDSFDTLLPRLPDTREELQSIAQSLGVDPATTLHLGTAANEQTVKTADLARYRIVAFATHGLVPGDLRGLTQPALALTHPKVAGIEGDGLLTMEEIVALKLDADWVLLSACNTSAGTSVGSDAASGLGRAFFYAGSRALLLTNWAVHSLSARDLVTDLFRRQVKDPKLSRAEALRQATMALLDGAGYVDSEGKTLFAYAHPLFWAPYSIIGDGGRN